MLSFPNCKINIGLRIHRRRTDGFHNIESVFYPVQWCDALEIVPSGKFSFEYVAHSNSKGLHTHTDLTNGNLCAKAYHLLHKEFDLDPVKMFLLKKIPIGSGLGGGSADAAFTLKMLDELFDLELVEKQLMHYAALLGSDVPFFVKNIPMMVTGRGEVQKKINVDLSGYHITVVVPDVHINTGAAYAALDEFRKKEKVKTHDHAGVRDYLPELPVEEWKNFIENDFEEVVFKEHPAIKKIKKKLYASGAVYASMSGTGSSVYGIFKTPHEKLDFGQSFTVFNSPL